MGNTVNGEFAVVIILITHVIFVNLKVEKVIKRRHCVQENWTKVCNS